MTQIFFTKCSEAIPYENKLLPLLSNSEREKLKKIKVDSRRITSLVSCLILLRESSLPFSTEIGYGEHGRPFLNGVHFSISHTGDIAVIALSDFPVGIDIESGEDKSGKIAERFFDESEKEYLRQCPSGFRRVWTLKEAVSKLFGKGISMDFPSFCVYPFDTEHYIEGKYVTFCCKKIYDLPVSVASFQNDENYTFTEINLEDYIKEILI